MPHQDTMRSAAWLGDGYSLGKLKLMLEDLDVFPAHACIRLVRPEQLQISLHLSLFLHESISTLLLLLQIRLPIAWNSQLP